MEAFIVMMMNAFPILPIRSGQVSVALIGLSQPLANLPAAKQGSVSEFARINHIVFHIYFYGCCIFTWQVKLIFFL